MLKIWKSSFCWGLPCPCPQSASFPTHWLPANLLRRVSRTYWCISVNKNNISPWIAKTRARSAFTTFIERRVPTIAGLEWNQPWLLVKNALAWLAQTWTRRLVLALCHIGRKVNGYIRCSRCFYVGCFIGGLEWVQTKLDLSRSKMKIILNSCLDWLAVACLHRRWPDMTIQTLPKLSKQLGVIIPVQKRRVATLISLAGAFPELLESILTPCSPQVPAQTFTLHQLKWL